MKKIAAISLLGASLALTACGTEEEDAPLAGSYVLGSVVIDADGTRTTYVQTVESLEDGLFTNENAIEMPGNGVLMAGGEHLFVGLAEEPTWIRYTLQEGGGIARTGELSLLEYGARYIDYGYAYVDAEHAVSVISSPPLAVIWNPTTMEVRGTVGLEHLKHEGYDLEVWTTVAHDGLVYIPGRGSDWVGGRILDGVAVAILDPRKMDLVGTAQDDRCNSGGRIVFDEAGYGYVMGDGRNYCHQMFATARDEQEIAENCILRIAPGATDFEADYFHTVKSITGGYESIGEFETAQQGSGIAFSKIFYPERLPAEVKPVDFTFWGHPVHKTWRIVLGDTPSAQEVEGVPFSVIGFGGSGFEGKLYSGESADGSTSDVYEIDPATNQASLKFRMDGYFNGLYELKR
ncbi:hypothetical protein [Vulgatibacter sp.]|uniref:hypothetical protein n=1 Tax=Vulgatibacter sp. TaxID=1971226 RepID=UPI00356482BB